MNYTVFLLVASLAGYALSGLVASPADQAGAADPVAEAQADEGDEDGAAGVTLKG